MSVAEGLVSVVRSSEFVRLLARAPTTTIPQVQFMLAEKAEAALLSYIPALQAAKMACERAGDICKTKYLEMRKRLVAEVCELLGINWLIDRLLSILRRLPAYMRQILDTVADVWYIIEQWSKGEFRVGQIALIFRLATTKWKDTAVMLARMTASAAKKVGGALYYAGYWLACKAYPAVAEAIADAAKLALTELFALPLDLVAAALSAVGFEKAAETMKAISKGIGKAVDAAVDCVAHPYECVKSIF